MARFVECRTSQGVVYQVNVDQITYNAALRTNTREFISWGLISRLASKRPHNKLWGRLTVDAPFNTIPIYRVKRRTLFPFDLHAVLI